MRCAEEGCTEEALYDRLCIGHIDFGAVFCVVEGCPRTAWRSSGRCWAHPKPRNSKLAASGVRGVYWDAASDKWRAVLRYRGAKHYGVAYDTVEEAARAVDRLRAKITAPGFRDTRPLRL